MNRKPTPVEHALAEVLVLLPEFNDAKAGRLVEIIQACAKRAQVAEMRRVLALLNDIPRRWDGESEPPYWAATNTIVQELSFIEGRSIEDIVGELKAENPPP